MAWTTAAAIYFIIWWMVLFAVLPFGVRNASEAGIEVEPGHDPGAPTVLGMRAKLIWTTLISAVLVSTKFVGSGDVGPGGVSWFLSAELSNIIQLRFCKGTR